MTGLPSASRTQEERSRLMQAQLIKSTAEIIQEVGVDATTLAAIARHAGVTTGAIQHHFASKADLMMQALQTILIHGTEQGILWPSPDLCLTDRAHDFIQNAWDLIYQTPRFITDWKTYLASDDRPVLLDQIDHSRKRINAWVHEEFVNAFPELKNDTEVNNFINVILSSLRGLGLLQCIPNNEGQAQKQRHCLAELIIARCNNFENKDDLKEVSK